MASCESGSMHEVHGTCVQETISRLWEWRPEGWDFGVGLGVRARGEEGVEWWKEEEARCSMEEGEVEGEGDVKRLKRPVTASRVICCMAEAVEAWHAGGRGGEECSLAPPEGQTHAAHTTAPPPSPKREPGRAHGRAVDAEGERGGGEGERGRAEGEVTRSGGLSGGGASSEGEGEGDVAAEGEGEAAQTLRGLESVLDESVSLSSSVASEGCISQGSQGEGTSLGQIYESLEAVREVLELSEPEWGGVSSISDVIDALEHLGVRLSEAGKRELLMQLRAEDEGELIRFETILSRLAPSQSGEVEIAHSSKRPSDQRAQLGRPSPSWLQKALAEKLEGFSCVLHRLFELAPTSLSVFGYEERCFSTIHPLFAFSVFDAHPLLTLAQREAGFRKKGVGQRLEGGISSIYDFARAGCTTIFSGAEHRKGELTATPDVDHSGGWGNSSVFVPGLAYSVNLHTRSTSIDPICCMWRERSGWGDSWGHASQEIVPLPVLNSSRARSLAQTLNLSPRLLGESPKAKVRLHSRKKKDSKLTADNREEEEERPFFLWQLLLAKNPHTLHAGDSDLYHNARKTIRLGGASRAPPEPHSAREPRVSSEEITSSRASQALERAAEEARIHNEEGAPDTHNIAWNDENTSSLVMKSPLISQPPTGRNLQEINRLVSEHERLRISLKKQRQTNYLQSPSSEAVKLAQATTSRYEEEEEEAGYILQFVEQRVRQAQI
ncbi:MAG: hypothetical protein SGPRY_009290 [Prymnesium sp.]